MNLFIDIETIPTQDAAVIEEVQFKVKPPSNYKTAEAISKWWSGKGNDALEKAHRDTSFCGTVGEIICIAWAIDDENVQGVYRGLDGSEKELLEDFWTQLLEACTLEQGGIIKPTWIGHYITGFDLRFIWQRSVINNVKPTVAIPYNAKPWSEFVFDTKIEWDSAKSSGFGTQDIIAKAMGLEGKGDIDGSMVWDYIKEGRALEVMQYCKHDVTDNRSMYRRMVFA